jgi:hypothetical protein
MFITVIVCLYLLKKGHYNASANTISTIAAFLFVGMMFYSAIAGNSTGYISFTFYMPVIIIVSALYNRLRWVVGISIFFIVSTIVCTVMMRNLLTDIYARVLKELAVDYIFFYCIIIYFMPADCPAQ